MVTEKRREQLRSATERYRNQNRELCLQRTRELKKRYVQEGRCTGCGIKLVQGEKRTCVNCSHAIKGEMKYAKDISFTSKKF